MTLRYIISKIIKKLHIPAIKNSDINKTSKVCSASQIVNTKIGRFSYVGNNCTVVQTEIGNFCSIADNCIIGGASHPLDWVSTSPVFYKGKNVINKNFSNHDYEVMNQTIIMNDVWIGSNVLIKGGLKISNGAVIGMGSVLTKNVGPYEIWGGNPAKLIRKRFNDDTINFLLKSEWWNNNDLEIIEHAIFFNDVKKFKKRGIK